MNSIAIVRVASLKKKFKEVREQRSMTLYQLAKLTGVSWQNLRNIEQGRTNRIEFDLLERLCSVLECQPGDLLAVTPHEEER